MTATSTSGYDYNFHRTVIYSGVAFFTVAGIFGNLNLILVHLRKSSLRTKYGILLCALSIFQTMCLCFEWVGVIYTLITPIIVRLNCFYLMFVYVFVHCLQTGILAMISVDLLISVVFPVRHRKSPNYSYCALICIPPIIYGIISVVLGFHYADKTELTICNPPQSLQTIANTFWYFGALLAGGIVIVNYAVVYLMIFIKSRRERKPLEMERRAMKSLSVILFVFIFSRYFGVLFSNFLIFTNADPAFISLYQSYNAFFALALYSQNFYVCYWRSTEYRSLLKEQLLLAIIFFFPNSQWLKDKLPTIHIFTIRTKGHSFANTKSTKN